jgi:hypothetical protein
MYHKHIFFEDGLTPPNIGHMGKAGLGQDSGHNENEYTHTRNSLNDPRMRQAVADVGDPGPYGLFTNNCQDYVEHVLDSYDATEPVATPPESSQDAGVSDVGANDEE